MNCPACGRAFPLASGERVAFRDTCGGCGADLHACRACIHHDPGAYNACREPNAERVLDPERGNRCEYFRPGGTDGAVEGSGAADGGGETALDRAQALFRK